MMNFDLFSTRDLRRVAPPVLALALVAAVGPLFLSAYWLNTFTTVACLAIVSSTAALLYGQLGMVSLAQFAFAGVGGWVCLRVIHGWGIPFELAIVAGALAAGLVGVVVGLPALRMRGLFLGLLTLMVAAAFQTVVNVIGFPDGGAGFAGKVVNGQRILIERPWLATSDAAYFRYAVCWLVAGIAAIEWQRNRTPGRAWALIRKSEAAAIAAGIDVVRFKAWAFFFSGALAGVGGGLIAGLNGQLDNTGFHASQSILLYALTIVGGAYHWLGAIFAGLLMRAMPALLNDQGVDGNLANVFFGFALLVSLIQGRTGIAGQLTVHFARMPRWVLAEGLAAWCLLVALAMWLFPSWFDTGLAGSAFLAFMVLLLRLTLAPALWMLLGFVGRGFQAAVGRVLGACCAAAARLPGAWAERLLCELLNAALVGTAVAVVAMTVFDADFMQVLLMALVVYGMRGVLLVPVSMWAPRALRGAGARPSHQSIAAG